MAITANNDLRLKMKRGKVYYWMLARELDIAESTLIRWLRTELEGNRRQEVTDAVDRLIEGMK